MKKNTPEAGTAGNWISRPVVAAWVYTGWHKCPERDNRYGAHWTEWDMVMEACPHFEGHCQPRIPLYGTYDDSLPETAARQVAWARQYGIDLFVHGIFWSRGKRVLEKALDCGFTRADTGFPFAVMWANRMPRGVRPVKAIPQPVIDPGRLVYTDPDDFLDFVRFVCRRYFIKPGYFMIDGCPLLSIFDSTFFIRQMGEELCAHAISMARGFIQQQGFPDLHLMAVNPAPAWLGVYRRVGFDSVTHYVYLPHWKGEYLQDYNVLAEERSATWHTFARQTGLPYFPSVATGWDATPRGVMHPGFRPRQYPWWPIVTGEHPDNFSRFLKQAIRYTMKHNSTPLTFVASLNEWSEGHYLEPDRKHGFDWFQAVVEARRDACITWA